jgi:hypothetical protein
MRLAPSTTPFMLLALYVSPLGKVISNRTPPMPGVAIMIAPLMLIVVID